MRSDEDQKRAKEEQPSLSSILLTFPVATSGDYMASVDDSFTLLHNELFIRILLQWQILIQSGARVLEAVHEKRKIAWVNLWSKIKKTLLEQRQNPIQRASGLWLVLTVTMRSAVLLLPHTRVHYYPLN